MARSSLLLSFLLAACVDAPEPTDEVLVPDTDAHSADEVPGDAVAAILLPGRPRGPGHERPVPDTDDTDDAPLEPADTGLVGVPPRCALLAPTDGAQLPGDEPTVFTGEASDPDGDLSYVLWSSDRWGAMFVGLSFPFQLSSGPHEVTMAAIDTAGHACVRRIHVDVAPR